MNRMEISILFDAHLQFFAEFENCYILLIQHVSIQHCYVRQYETIKILERLGIFVECD